MNSVTSQATTQLLCMQPRGPFMIVHKPIPVLGPDEVLIKQRVVTLNLVDVKQLENIPNLRWPRILGLEGGGVIASTGSAVHNLKAGDQVVGWEGSGALPDSWGGAFQEHVALPAHMLAKKPRNVSLEEAASLPIGFVTAVCAIVNSLGIPLPFIKGLRNEGEAPSSILVLGGSSAVGAAAIQLLRIAYPELPILTTSSPKHKSRLVELGATSVVYHKSVFAVRNLQAASPAGEGVDMIIDCVSAGASQPDICDVLSATGSRKYAAIVTGAPICVPENVKKFDVLASAMFNMQGGKELIPSLTELVEEGKYRIPLPVTVVGHGLNALPNVLEKVKSVSGEKLVVTL